MNLDFFESKFKKLAVFLNSKEFLNWHYPISKIPPNSLEIDITFKCNYDCEMCPRPRRLPKGELTFSDWQKMMKDPIFIGIKGLCISGGEPFLHPKLLELIFLFIKSMPNMQSLHINTNGFFTEKIIFLVRTLAPILDKKGIKLSFLVSLDGIGEKHNNIRRNPQSFYAVEKTISALKLLREKYIFEFFVNCTLFRKNLHEISNIEKWCESQKISFRFNMINFFDIGFVKNIDKKRELDFREEDKKYLFKVLEELSSNNHLVSAVRNYSLEVLRLYKDNAHRITICPFVKNGFRIDPCGNIYYCFKQNMIGNFLKDRSVSKIFYLPKNLINRQKIAEETCRYCNAFCRTL